MNRYPESLSDRCKYLEQVVATLKEVCEAHERHIDELRLELRTQAEIIERGEDYSLLWVWQGDGYDYIRSMTSDLPALIRAADLRQLVERGERVADEDGSTPITPNEVRLVDALKRLMEWQVKNVTVWHNSAYDNAAKLLNDLTSKHINQQTEEE